MPIDRRSIITGAAALPGAALAGGRAAAAPLPAHGLDAAQLGVRAGGGDQSRALQRAIDQAAQKRLPLNLGPGLYRAAELRLPSGAHIAGVSGATRLSLERSGALFNAEQADNVMLSGLVIDGGKIAPPGHRGLINMSGGRNLHITGCEITRAGGDAIHLAGVSGEISGVSITETADTAIFSLDGAGLLVRGNIIRASGNGGIRIWQSEKREDGTIVADNRIEDTLSRSGGSGQNGNAINIYRAAGVIVRGNNIRNAAFSAVRGNGASNIQIIGNNCAAIGEVALYAEFDFEGAAITGNTVDGASTGIAVTNYDKGGRLAVVQGNLLRNMTARPPQGTEPGDSYGIGIAVEADTAVTGNVIETATHAGIAVGYGPYMRDVTVTGNIVRSAAYGITVSVANGAGAAVVAHNLLSGTRRGAIVGTEWKKIVTGDLAIIAPGVYPQLTITANQVR